MLEFDTFVFSKILEPFNECKALPCCFRNAEVGIQPYVLDLDALECYSLLSKTKSAMKLANMLENTIGFEST